MIVLYSLFSMAHANADFCTHDQLAVQDRKALRITRNTVFARHGRAFASKDLQEYFGQQPWYQVRSDFSEKQLNQADLDCVERVQLWEKKRGKKMLDVDMTGDGKTEGVYLFDTRPKSSGDLEGICEGSCFVYVGYDRFVHKLAMNWKRGSDYHELAFGISDVDRSTPQKEIYLQHYQPWMEDPARNSDFMWVYNGKSHQKRVEASYYNAGGLDFSKKGLVAVEDADDCVVSKKTWYAISGSSMTQQKIDYSKDMSGGFMYEDGSGYGCPACPYVYLEYGSKKVFLGEILRDQVGADALQWDSLDIPTTHTKIRIHLAEEKKEITYLDTLYLQVGDVQLAPISCETEIESWCEQDSLFLTLHPEESITFDFVLPPDVRIQKGTVSLYAYGYYEPIP